MTDEKCMPRAVLPCVGRRTFLGAACALLATGGLTACKTSTTGKITTISVDAAEIDTDGTAGLNIIKTILAFTGVPAPVVTVADTAIDGVETALAAWDKYCDGTATITYDASNVPSAAISVVTALQKAAATIGAVASTESGALGTSLASKIAAVAADVASVGSIISSAVKAVESASLGAATSGLSPAQLRTQRVNAILARHGLAAVSLPG